MTTKFLTARTELLFLIEETTKGLLKVPIGTSALRLIDDPTFDQMIAAFLSKERKNTYDYTKRFTTRYPAGKFAFKIYIKPSGTLGTAPVGGSCLKGLFGKETIVPATSVTYESLKVSDGLPKTYSAFFKAGDIVLQMSGCIFEKGTFNCNPGPVEDSEVAGLFEGEFFCQHIAAPSAAASNQIITDLVVTVADATQFLNTPFIEVLKADGTTHGPYHVSAIDYSTNVITIDTVGGWTAAITTAVDTIRGYVPTAVDSGNLVNWAFGVTQEDGNDIFITGAEVVYQNGYKVIDNQKNGLLYPNDFMINGLREIKVNNVTFYFDAAEQGDLFYQAQKLQDKAWELPFGDQDGTTGNTGKFVLPKLELETSPKIQSAGGNELTLVENMIALENAGSDACSLSFP